MSESTYPAYLALAASGELKQRVTSAMAKLSPCQLCPRACQADRLQNKTGFCRVGKLARVSSHGPHLGEEDCLRGWRGSGTIFFAGCNLGCVFCQNWDISHELDGVNVTPEGLAAMMLELQNEGCHNLNLVTPTHVLPQILAALALAVEQHFHLPIVYNSGAYDTVETLRLLEGIVDIYLPDFKFWHPQQAERLVRAGNYPEVARSALREMHRQVGDLVSDENGLARRGILLRHLVMPQERAGTGPLAKWLADELSPHTYLNLMAQYHPAGRLLQHNQSSDYQDVARPITSAEYQSALRIARAAGLHRFDR